MKIDQNVAKLKSKIYYYNNTKEKEEEEEEKNESQFFPIQIYRSINLLQ